MEFFDYGMQEFSERGNLTDLYRDMLHIALHQSKETSCNEKHHIWFTFSEKSFFEGVRQLFVEQKLAMPTFRLQ